MAAIMFVAFVKELTRAGMPEQQAEWRGHKPRMKNIGIGYKEGPGTGYEDVEQL